MWKNLKKSERKRERRWEGTVDNLEISLTAICFKIITSKCETHKTKVNQSNYGSNASITNKTHNNDKMWKKNWCFMLHCWVSSG